MRRRLEQRLEAYRDGAVSERERRRVERVVASDPASARHLRQTAALGAAIRDAWMEGPVAPAPEAFLSAVRPALREVDADLSAERPGARVRRWVDGLRVDLRPVAAGGLAAALLALVLAWPALRQSPWSGSPPAQTAPAFQASAPVPISTVVASPGAIYDLAQGERPLMVFEGEDGSTIIWILEEDDQLSWAPAAREGWA